jgi:hypothetical protein
MSFSLETSKLANQQSYNAKPKYSLQNPGMGDKIHIPLHPDATIGGDNKQQLIAYYPRSIAEKSCISVIDCTKRDGKLKYFPVYLLVPERYTKEDIG